MAIRNWHFGKMVLLWAWGVILIVVALQRLESTKNFVFGFPLIATLITIPLVLSVITWKWLSGKEK